jgi:hypothetical protein
MCVVGLVFLVVNSSVGGLMRSMLMSVVTALFLVCTGLAPTVSWAADDAGSPAVSDKAEMPGCPGKADGAPCCTSCQDKIAQGVDPSKSEGGCPCQRARKAREAAAAKAREAAAQ